MVLSWGRFSCYVEETTGQDGELNESRGEERAVDNRRGPEKVMREDRYKTE